MPSHHRRGLLHLENVSEGDLQSRSCARSIPCARANHNLYCPVLAGSIAGAALAGRSLRSATGNRSAKGARAPCGIGQTTSRLQTRGEVHLKRPAPLLADDVSALSDARIRMVEETGGWRARSIKRANRKSCLKAGWPALSAKKRCWSSPAPRRFRVHICRGREKKPEAWAARPDPALALGVERVKACRTILNAVHLRMERTLWSIAGLCRPSPTPPRENRACRGPRLPHPATRKPRVSGTPAPHPATRKPCVSGTPAPGLAAFSNPSQSLRPGLPLCRPFGARA